MPDSRKRSSASDLHDQFAHLPVKERTMKLLAAAHEAAPPTRKALNDVVVEINMPIAAQVAARYRNRGVPREDLEQVAYLALVGAVDRYEYAPERNFLSFAVPSVRGEVRRYFRDLGWMIRPTRPVQVAQARIGHAEAELLQELGRSPRPSEIAARIGMELEVVIEAMSANGLFTPASFDSMSDDDGGSWEGPGIPELGYGAAEARAMLKPLMANLNRRERLMLEMRFFRGATQAEVGQAIGVTQMQVSRLLSALLARLQDQLTTPEPPTGRVA